MTERKVALASALMLVSCSPGTEEKSKSANPSVGVVTYVVPERVGSPPTPPVRSSAFTTLDMASCDLVEENREEGSYWRRACSAPPGWRVEWTESDLRQGLVVTSSAGNQTNLRLSELVARGAFNSLGKTIEWRGKFASDPDALVVRMNVANGRNGQGSDVSKLAVVRLTPKPCLIAVIDPAANQNVEARVIADSPDRSCIKD